MTVGREHLQRLLPARSDREIIKTAEPVTTGRQAVSAVSGHVLGRRSPPFQREAAGDETGTHKLTGPHPLPPGQNKSAPVATSSCTDGCHTRTRPADPDAAWNRYARFLRLLIVAAVAVKEGREAWRGEDCC
ncbi:hypothetical protein ACLRGI_07605 [Paenarthrobacter nitroguajacolicus]|uniref:hypothetical protein n=1 Tax=Paenarthrobacter nitroguajacolicus TaxID=211146 RepID=UPI003AEF0038